MTKRPLYVHKKVSKGKTYYYFDTGLRDDRARRILSRLPDLRSHTFGTAYAAAKASRTKQAGDTGAKTFDWLVRLYERSPEFRALALNSQKQYSRHLGYANASFRNRHGASAPLSLVTAERVLMVRDLYAETPGKANAILKALGALFAWASKKGRKYVKENIAAGIDPFDGGEHEPWPEWLIETALDDSAIRLPVALLYFLGQRIGDTVKLGRGNVAHGTVMLTQEKTGTSLEIPIHKRLAAILEADVPKGQLVFMLSEKGSPVTESGLRQRIQKWAKANHGIHVVPHGLRKNAVNALLAAECSVAEVSAITGQSFQMIEYYAKKRDKAKLGQSAILKFEAKNK